MKTITVLIICAFFSVGLNAQSFIGAWESYHNSENGDNLKSVVIFGDGYQVIATYDLKSR